jgi:outer membrane protein OmpA-like peptidoglycan-associated protein
MKLVLMIAVCFCVTISTIVAQDSLKLKLGDKAPSLVLPAALNTIQSFNFPYNNRIVLLFFWSSTVSVSKENLFKYKLINSKYNSLPFKNCEGFEMISVALQSDKKLWEQDVKKYNLGKINNCIALKGYKDFYVSKYNLTETPTSFLIDELGKIISINPNIETLVEYLEERKNTLNGNDQQNSIVGKIVFGSDVLKPLVNKKISILNNKNDTIEITKTDNLGIFHAKNPKTSIKIYLKTEPNETINDGDNVYLANETGESIAYLNVIKSGYLCNLNEVDLLFLKPNNDTKSKLKNLKNLNVTDNLFKSGGFTLSVDAIKILNTLIIKLNENSKAQLEIISHTDCKGDAKINLELSNKRGKSIYDYLISKGINKNRLIIIGKGESEPINKCKDGVICSAKENDLNVRTEFKFTEID